MIFGAGVLSVGYFMLALPNDQLAFMYASLGVIVVGNGLFKANAANLVRRIYEGDDARIDSAFTIYYMAVNIGSTVSMLATPWIKDHWGWHTAFAVCCAGMLLSVAELLRDVPHARAYRLRAGRRTGALEARRRGRAGRPRARRGDHVRAAAQGDRGRLRVHGGRRDSGDLRLHAAEVRTLGALGSCSLR